MPKDSEINKKGKHNPGKNRKKGIVERAGAAAAEQMAKTAQEATTPHVPTLPAIPNYDSPQYERGLYSDELLPKIEELASKGLTNREIAESFCIGERTFYDWKKKYPQVQQALKKYRGVANIQVENALINNALGQVFTEVKRERRWNKALQCYEIVITETTDKFIPGNVTAQIFYLKNRMPERYKDKIEQVHSLGAGMDMMAFALKRRED